MPWHEQVGYNSWQVRMNRDVGRGLHRSRPESDKRDIQPPTLKTARHRAEERRHLAAHP